MNRKAEKRRTLDLRQARALKMAVRVSAMIDEHARRSVAATESIQQHILALESDAVGGYALRRAARGG